MTDLNGAQIAGAGMVEEDGIFYVSKKARDFFSEMVKELKACGWDFVGDVSLTPIASGDLMLDGRVKRIIKQDD